VHVARRKDAKAGRELHPEESDRLEWGDCLEWSDGGGGKGASFGALSLLRALKSAVHTALLRQCDLGVDVSILEVVDCTHLRAS
jgi:hypothetical protein